MDHHIHFTTKTSLTFLISISSLLLIANAVPSTRNIHIVRRDISSDITEFCKKTTNPNLCTQTIQPHFLKSNVDPFKALNVEVDATLNEAKKTIADIQTMETKQGTSKSEKDSLKTCKDQYNSMLDAIAETKAAITKQDVTTAKFKFSAVLSFQAACADAFDGGKIPFPEDSDKVYNLGGNCLDIIAAMEKTEAPKKMPPVQQTPSAFSSVIGTVS